MDAMDEELFLRACKIEPLLQQLPMSIPRTHVFRAYQRNRERPGSPSLHTIAEVLKRNGSGSDLDSRDSGTNDHEPHKAASGEDLEGEAVGAEV